MMNYYYEEEKDVKEFFFKYLEKNSSEEITNGTDGTF